MKQITLAIFLLISSFSLVKSQEVQHLPELFGGPDYPLNALKLTAGISYRKKGSAFGFFPEHNVKTHFPEVTWVNYKKERSWSEISIGFGFNSNSSIFDDSLGNIVGGNRIVSSNSGIGLGQFWDLRKDQSKSLHLTFGVAVALEYSHQKTLPYSSSEFLSSASSLEIPIKMIPGIRIFTKRKVFFDLRIPVIIYALSFETTINDDPSLPILQRRQSYVQLDMPLISSANFQAGIGLFL